LLIPGSFFVLFVFDVFAGKPLGALCSVLAFTRFYLLFFEYVVQIGVFPASVTVFVEYNNYREPSYGVVVEGCAGPGAKDPAIINEHGS
jgi:hypothetical protein